MNIEGRYQQSAKGFGFFIPDDRATYPEDWFIPPKSQGGAWNGDRVTAVLERGDPGGQRQSGAITAVLERTNRTVTGAAERRGREWWLVPDSDRLRRTIRVLGHTKGLRPGDKIAVGMVSFGGRDESPVGTLKAVFGPGGTRTATVAAILYGQGIEPEFPAAVTAAADLAPGTVDPSAAEGRLDLRDKLVITIDGASAKDLDDAVSLERDGAGRLVLGVHIADVSHYVPQGSPLDLEAWERGTSVYFADKVIPMLPVALSNGICSLNPGVDRLALSCIMTLDESGAVVEHTIAQSVLRTTQRMTYDDCNALLAGGDAALEERYGAILPMLRDMGALAATLEKRRRLRGALELESTEAYILCDEAGAPVEVVVRASGGSEKLIESFMLVANETVARHMKEKNLPSVYRVHEKPSEDKTTTLRTMLAPLGYNLREADHAALQKVLDGARGTPQAPAINAMVLRSLMKARYDGENLGHFGLAAEFYCHFTSPIRRYPDLMVHRILTQSLDKKLEKTAKLTTLVQRAAVQSSEREVAAMTAEREIEKCYMAEYMQSHLGETFPGSVSGVTRFGLFVILHSGVEGLLPVTALPDDFYDYDEVRMTLCGTRSGAVYAFGMPLEVTCVAADPATGQIDFHLPGVEPRARTAAPAAPKPPRNKPTTRRPGHAPKRKRGRGKG